MLKYMGKQQVWEAGKKYAVDLLRYVRLAVSGSSKRHTIIAGGIVASLAIIGVFSFTAWQHWRHQQLRVVQRVLDSSVDGIHVESNTYHNDHLQGYVTYALTENSTINDNIRRVANAYFLPCKDAGLSGQVPQPLECNAALEVDFATPEYIGVTYTFRQYVPVRSDARKKISLVFDRQSGKQLVIGDIFKQGAPYLDALSRLSSAALAAQFADKVNHDKQLRESISRLTRPHADNFNNFTFNKDEKLVIAYNDISPAVAGATQVALAPDELYSMFSTKVAAVFLPKLAQQKEAEKKLAEQADIARQRADGLVATNRFGINCLAIKCIALTYDDGPHATYGPRLLDILKERGAVATFFVLGSKVSAHAAILQRVVAEGSEIGNHSWSHSSLANLSATGIADEVKRTEQAIFSATGRYSRLMRPPYGAFNLQVAAHAGLPLALWSIDTADWRDRNADVVYRRVIDAAKPGAVVLMHEIHQAAVDASPRIIDELHRQGYTLVTMSELFGITGENVQQLNGQVLRHR